MDIEISTFYETFINDLRSLNKLSYLNFSKKEINHYINQLERIAILRYRLIGTTHLEKEIAFLDNIEDKFIENLQRLIIFPKVIHPAQSTPERFFMGFTCFFAFAAYWGLCIILLSAPLTLPTAAVLTFFAVSAFIIFQVNSIRLLENKPPVLSLLEETGLSIVRKNLKNITLELEQPISLLEDKTKYLESQISDFAQSYAKHGFLISFLKPSLQAIKSNPSDEDNNNITAPSQGPVPAKTYNR